MNRIRIMCIMCIISILCLVLLAGCPRMPWQSAQQYGTTGEGTGNTTQARLLMDTYLFGAVTSGPYVEYAKFNLSGFIPADSDIVDASLWVYQYQNTLDPAFTANVTLMNTVADWNMTETDTVAVLLSYALEGTTNQHAVDNTTGWKRLNITQVVEQAYTLGKVNLSIRIIQSNLNVSLANNKGVSARWAVGNYSNNAGPYAFFYDRAESTYFPRIEVTYTGAGATIITASSPTLCNATACTTLGTPYHDNPASLNASGNCSTDGGSATLTGNFTFYRNTTAYQSNLTYNWLANQTNYTNASASGLIKSDSWKVGLICYNSTYNSSQVNSSAITVNNTAPSQTAGTITSNDTGFYTTSLLTCENGTFSDADSDSRNATAYWKWWLNNTNQLSGHTGTLNVSAYGLNATDKLNCSVIVNDTGYNMKPAPEVFSTAVVIVGNTGTPNLNLTLPAGQTAANFTCAQAYMNNTPPNGQTVTIPFLNVTNNATGTYYNLTLYLNQSLTTGFSIWTQPSYHRNPSSINVSTTPQIIIKRLNVGESVGLWMWGECYNVSDNQSMSFEFAFSGGT